MSAIDNARAALAYVEPGFGHAAILDLLAEHERLQVVLGHRTAQLDRLTAEGSCWDEAPSIVVPRGECAPMPARCELRAGHGGAHKSGSTEWMRRSPISSSPTDTERRRVMEDMLRSRLLPNEVIEYLNGYLEAMDEDAANHTDRGQR